MAPSPLLPPFSSPLRSHPTPSHLLKNKGKRCDASGAQPLKTESHLFSMCNIFRGGDQRTLTLMPTGNTGEREGWGEGAIIE